MKSKIHSYLGFARKSGNLSSGYNTCVFEMKKGRIKLLLVTSDISENTGKKIRKEAEAQQVPYRTFGNSDDLSRAVGVSGRSIFGITDENFANVILKEIGQIREKEKEEF